MKKYSDSTIGIICAFGAFFMWGIFPIYFKAIDYISPYEVLVHRIFWSFIMLLIILFFIKGFGKVKDIFLNRKKLIPLFITSILITSNWLIYIIAVMEAKIAEASLGYFINPLVNILLGIVFLKENPNNAEKIAIFIAFIAILQEAISHGSVPYISIALALSFGFYGLIRKKIAVDSFSGLFVETTVVLPFVCAYVLFFIGFSNLSFLNSSNDMFFLMLAGPITVLPLLLFSAAANRIRLGTIGFIQYLSPTCTFLLAVLVYNESLDIGRLITFILIWISLIIVTINSIKNSQRKKDA
ncbi:MAG: EamA family transporter RarD [Campylobacteraceae bacterium]